MLHLFRHHTLLRSELVVLAGGLLIVMGLVLLFCAGADCAQDSPTPKSAAGLEPVELLGEPCIGDAFVWVFEEGNSDAATHIRAIVAEGLRSLSDQHQFSLVGFRGPTWLFWSHRLQDGNAHRRDAALSWLDRDLGARAPKGHGLLETMVRGLTLAATTDVDGRPQLFLIVEAASLKSQALSLDDLRTIHVSNYRRHPVHTVLVGTGRSEFLSLLARWSGGDHYHVDPTTNPRSVVRNPIQPVSPESPHARQLVAAPSAKIGEPSDEFVRNYEEAAAERPFESMRMATREGYRRAVARRTQRIRELQDSLEVARAELDRLLKAAVDEESVAKQRTIVRNAQTELERSQTTQGLWQEIEREARSAIASTQSEYVGSFASVFAGIRLEAANERDWYRWRTAFAELMGRVGRHLDRETGGASSFTDLAKGLDSVDAMIGKFQWTAAQTELDRLWREFISP